MKVVSEIHDPRLAYPFAAVIAAALIPGLAPAQSDARVVVAKSSSPAATFSARPASGNQFRTLPEKEDLYSGDLIVSLPGGTLVSKNGAVRVKSLADFDSRAALPILETALSLADSASFDLDLALDRGRVDFTNTKSSGTATARVRFWDQSWKIVLDSPNSRVSVGSAGVGRPARLKPARPAKIRKAPAIASFVLLLLEGSASVDVGGVTLAAQAPPGLHNSRGTVWRRGRNRSNWEKARLGESQRGTTETERKWRRPSKFRKARVESPSKAIG